MRVIERKMVDAIRERRSWKEGNTKVYRQDTYSDVWLYDKHIANVHDDGTIDVNEFTLAAWPTVTTMSRLRALGVNVYRKDWLVYLNDRRVVDRRVV